MNTIFIHSNNKQILGAYLAKYAIERFLKPENNITVKIINVDELPLFKALAGKKYLRRGEMIVYDPNDLQSFTLSRFMPPELMNFEGKAVVIDPDIFAVSDVSGIFNIDMEGKALACCQKKSAYDTAVMLMDCSKMTNWKMSEILEKLQKGELDYLDIITLKTQPPETIKIIDRIWNSLDLLTPETKWLHTTERLTQPWRTGLPIDFTINPLPKIFGLIPREPIHKLLGKYPTHYKPHPNKAIEKFFMDLTKEALAKGAITRDLIEKEVAAGHVRKDIFELIA